MGGRLRCVCTHAVRAVPLRDAGEGTIICDRALRRRPAPPSHVAGLSNDRKLDDRFRKPSVVPAARAFGSMSRLHFYSFTPI
jgi:hypothetical protein